MGGGSTALFESCMSSETRLFQQNKLNTLLKVQYRTVYALTCSTSIILPAEIM